MISVHHPKLRRLARILFVLYLLALLYILFLMDAREAAFHSVNWVPLRTIRMFFKYYFIHPHFSFSAWFNNIFGNIGLLVPMGFLLPILSGRRMSFLQIGMITFNFILIVEWLQYMTGVGAADIDDLILNLSGALIGYALYRLWLHKSHRVG